VHGGGVLAQDFPNINASTLAVLNWANLDSVSFQTSDDAGIDNITLNIPEPTMLALLGCAGLAAARRRQ
jgi:hypothetical protein